MTPTHDSHDAVDVASSAPAVEADAIDDDGPENVPANAWVTMGIFAVFVIAFGTCASTFMFN
ncbi:hypothetical protein [Leucobacter sp. G161]|uniref:hypothetical protein n=1 Tax=Leucobacter sp. G161 TaxID=663704 RepID=UPI00073B7E12|nr:hypothetical protein [Leucobacter sp. G161]KUF05957.1 hypothetical protein AUL38_15265 [Leucobacter sp. G161]